jgi:hypothetical protein
MLIQRSNSIIYVVTEVTLEAIAVPGRSCRDVLYLGIRVGEQLVCKETAWVTLTDVLEDSFAICVQGFSA